jgi:hypothetical protein
MEVSSLIPTLTWRLVLSYPLTRGGEFCHPHSHVEDRSIILTLTLRSVLSYFLTWRSVLSYSLTWRSVLLYSLSRGGQFCHTHSNVGSQFCHILTRRLVVSYPLSHVRSVLSYTLSRGGQFCHTLTRKFSSVITLICTGSSKTN